MKSPVPPHVGSRCETAGWYPIRPLHRKSKSTSKRKAARAGLDRPGKTALPKRPASTTEPTHLDLKDIKAVIDLMRKNDLSVFEMEKDGFRLKLQKGAGEQTVYAQPSPAPSALAPTAATAPAPGAEAEKAGALK